MKLTKRDMRLCGKLALERLGFSVKPIPGLGIVPGSRLKAVKGSQSLKVAVRTSLDREVGLMRLRDGTWKTIPKVDEVVVVALTVEGANTVEVLGFEAKIIIEVFDAALAARIDRSPGLSWKAPIFLPLDEERADAALELPGGLKAKAKWRLELPLVSQADASAIAGRMGFVERVKREFAELNGVDVSKVSVDFRITA